MSSVLNVDLISVVLQFCRFLDGINLLQVSQSYYHDSSLWRLLLLIGREEGPLYCYPGLEIQELDLSNLRTIGWATYRLWSTISRPTAPVRSVKTFDLPEEEYLLVNIPGCNIIISANFRILGSHLFHLRSTQQRQNPYLQCWDLETGCQLGEPLTLEDQTIMDLWGVVSNVWCGTDELKLALTFFYHGDVDHGSTLVVVGSNLTDKKSPRLRSILKMSLGASPFTMQPWIHKDEAFIIVYDLVDYKPHVTVKRVDLQDHSIKSCILTSSSTQVPHKVEELYVDKDRLYIIIMNWDTMKLSSIGVDLHLFRTTGTPSTVIASEVAWNTPSTVVLSNYAHDQRKHVGIFVYTDLTQHRSIFTFRQLRIENNELAPDTDIPASDPHGLSLDNIVANPGIVGIKGSISGRSLLYIEDAAEDERTRVRRATLIGFYSDESPIKCQLGLPAELEHSSIDQQLDTQSLHFDENLGLLVYPAPYNGSTTRVHIVSYI